MSFRCIACDAAIESRYTNCPECGEPVTAFLREYLEKPVGGNYQLLGKLGQGGMGEVYKAKHVYFHNEVVIKVMRPQLAGANSLTERFIQEARVARKIKHENVAQIFDFSALPDGSFYMVWELIEGKTLGQVIHERGVLPPEYVGQIAVQALRGLQAIHSAGFVHRDISPDNIMVTKDESGHDLVKIIDLGIAKQNSETGNTITGTGLFVGKLKYASPEHLGLLNPAERLDGRADLYSLGIVMYEMVAGKAPFIASTPHQFMAMQMNEPPPPLPVTSRGIAALQPLIFRALKKDRKDRFKSAKEFAEEIEATMAARRSPAEETVQVEPGEATWVPAQDVVIASGSVATDPDGRYQSTRDSHAEVREETEFWEEGQYGSGARPAQAEEIHFWDGMEYGSKAQPAPGVASAPVARRRFLSRSAMVGVILAVVVFVGGFAIYEAVTRREIHSGPAAATELPRFEMRRITSSGNVFEAIISPDAKYIAYSAREALWGKTSIWLKQLSSGQELKVAAGEETVVYDDLSFSPDSDFIYFTSYRAGPGLTPGIRHLNRIPIIGGASRRIQIAENVGSPVAVSPDGKSIAFVRYDVSGHTSLMTANSGGGGERLIAKRTPASEFLANTRLDWQDGEGIAVGTSDGHVVIIAVKTGATRLVPGEGWQGIDGALWTQDNMLLVNAAKTGKQYQLWQVDPATGESVQLTESLSGFGTMSASRDRKNICVTQSELNAHLYRMQLVSSESLQQITGGTSVDGAAGLAVSSDQIVFTSSSPVAGLFSAKLDGSERRSLTQLQTDTSPVFSADGKTIAYTLHGPVATTIRLIDSDGSNDRILAGVQSGADHPQFSPDGETVIYSCCPDATQFLWRVPVGGGKPMQLTTTMAFNPAVSPDGRWIACLNGKYGICTIPFRGGDLKELYRANTGTLHWTADSKNIIAPEFHDNTLNLFIHPLNGGPARQLTHFTSGLILGIDFTRDGQTVIFSRGDTVSDAVLLTMK